MDRHQRVRSCGREQSSKESRAALISKNNSQHPDPDSPLHKEKARSPLLSSSPLHLHYALGCQAKGKGRPGQTDALA